MFTESKSIRTYFAKFQTDDWIEDKTVPAGWKSWLIGSSGKELIFRPDGKQFVTRCIAFQHMFENITTLERSKRRDPYLC